MTGTTETFCSWQMIVIKRFYDGRENVNVSSIFDLCVCKIKCKFCLLIFKTFPKIKSWTYYWLYQLISDNIYELVKLCADVIKNVFV